MTWFTIANRVLILESNDTIYKLNSIRLIIMQLYHKTLNCVFFS